MIVSILKMNWQKGLPLKTLQHFYVKIQQLYLKKSVLIGFQIGITKVLFITQRTFAFIVTIVKRPMPVEKSFSVALNVPHVLHVIRPARTLKKNDVNDWTKLHQKDQIISPLIEQGQSPYQILTNPPELDMSVRSMYTYIDKGLFTARNIDLKRQAKFKPRKCHKTQITDRSVFTHRTYSDFCSLDLSSFVEMDTVHSSRESNKTLLTLFFTKEKLFLAFLLNRCTKGAVRLTFDRLEKRLGTYEFISVFENILTDRGSEFGDPVSLETGIHGIQRSSIYYCDPMRSGQKGAIEQAHTMLRMVLPKGTSFEFLTQWDVNLIVNNINSTPREILSGRTPYEVALETLGEDILKAFQLKPIEPDKVNLTPKLIRFNH